MKNKLPWVISVIVLITVMTIGLLSFHESTGCVDTLGDDYPTGNGPKPVVVVAEPCGNEQILSDANGFSFTVNVLRSVIWALVLGIITWGIAWIACWKNTTVLKKIGITLLLLTFAFIGFQVTPSITAAFLGGLSSLGETRGMITLALCIVLWLIGSLMLIRVIFRRKLNTKSSKTVHSRLPKA